MTLFDAYLMVDWSAASVPAVGRDSIWLCLAGRSRDGLRLEALENLPTRAAARRRIGELCLAARERGRRLLAGFDFPFGYPAGTAAALGLSGTPWRATWNEIGRLLKDDETNRNNRFEVGAALNRRLGRDLFWGSPNGRPFPACRRAIRAATTARCRSGASASATSPAPSRCGSSPMPARWAARR